jgi:imidazolonepropionase-like amidohydrolase
MTDITVIRASWLFDGVNDTLLKDPTVLVAGTAIRSVGPSEPVPDDANLVDLPGATLIPGFVDGHVHTVFDASADPVGHLGERDDAEAFATMLRFARTAARGGVTTMRDLGDRDYLSLGLRAATAKDPTLPHLLVAGPPITTPGGHCHFLGKPAAGVDGVRAAVRERAEQGVDIVKIMASGGNMTPGSRPEIPQYGRDELRAAVDEAHRCGLPITAHAHSPQAIVDGLAAGLTSFEHLSFMTADGIDPVSEEVLASLVDGGVTVGLTLGQRLGPGAEPPPGMVARLPALMSNGRRLIAAGVNVIAGTDAGISPIKPPDVIRYAVAQFQQLGMTLTQALHACTARPAQALGLGERKGRLAAGYDADIVAVDGDPRADPTAMHRIRAVYLRGTPLGL